MSETDASIVLPTFLVSPPETQLCTTLTGACHHGEIKCWPEAMQYLLLGYATASAILKVLKDLRNVKQKEEKNEERYLKRLKEAIFICGNVYSADKKITLLVDELSPTINMVLAHDRKSVHRRYLTFQTIFTLPSLKTKWSVHFFFI